MSVGYIVYQKYDEHSARLIHGYWPESAAEKFHEEVYHDWDYPETLELVVVSPDGSVNYYATTMEAQPTFFHNERNPDDKESLLEEAIKYDDLRNGLDE